jgi:hypothetical protein
VQASSTPPRSIALVALGLLLLGALVGALALDDYGLGFDENTQRLKIGRVNWNYLTGADRQTLPVSFERHYGPFFELILYAPEALNPSWNVRTVFRVRHALTFAMFGAAGLAFFAMLASRFGLLAGLCTSLMVFAAPRLFGDSFHNSKDIAFLAFAVLQASLLWAAIQRQSLPLLVAHAAGLGFAFSVRVLGIAFIATSLLIVPMATAGSPRRRIAAGLIVLLVSLATTFACWPVLWDSPAHLARAFGEMVAFPWNNFVLFGGARIRAHDLPVSYLPTWIALTTPPLTSLLSLLGLACFLFDASRVLRRDPTNRVFLFDAAMFASGYLVLAVILWRKPVVYDGWRHLFFVFPFIAYFAGYALARAVRQGSALLRWAGAIAGAAAALASVQACLALHPYQNVYFNFLAGPSLGEVQKKYELDYWGVAARHALSKVLAACSGPVVVATRELPIRENSFILPADQAARLRYVSDEPADFHIHLYRDGELPDFRDHPDLSVVVDGAVLIGVRVLQGSCFHAEQRRPRAGAG